MMTPPPPQDNPQTFGQRFRERGLVGALGKAKGGKNDPNKMHFLEHLEEMRWVIFKSFVAFVLGCVVVAAFLGDSVRLLQRPLISAVQDFGSLSIDLQATGLSQYQANLEEQGVELIDLIHATENDLVNWGVTDPQHRLRLLIHFAGGKDRNLLQVIRSYSPIFIAMKICFLGGIGALASPYLLLCGKFCDPWANLQRKKSLFSRLFGCNFSLFGRFRDDLLFHPSPIPGFHYRIFLQCIRARNIPSGGRKLLQYCNLDDFCCRFGIPISIGIDLVNPYWGTNGSKTALKSQICSCYPHGFRCTYYSGW